MTVVVDTNVILVANDAHAEVSPECVLECVQRLSQVMESGSIAIDDAYRILGEYLNKTSPSNGNGVGDLFVKWVLANMGNAQRVQQVPLNEWDDDQFAEFPAGPLEAVLIGQTANLPPWQTRTPPSHPFGRRPIANGWIGGPN